MHIQNQMSITVSIDNNNPQNNFQNPHDGSVSRIQRYNDSRVLAYELSITSYLSMRSIMRNE
jgi:hypothetical protein